MFSNCLLASHTLPVVTENPTKNEVSFPFIITTKTTFIKLPGNLEVTGLAVLSVFINKKGSAERFTIASLQTWKDGKRIFLKEEEKSKLHSLFSEYTRGHIRIRKVPGIEVNTLTEVHIPVRLH